jgi:uncharacterized protein YndB with AHSA1/START domain
MACDKREPLRWEQSDQAIQLCAEQLQPPMLLRSTDDFSSARVESLWRQPCGVGGLVTSTLANQAGGDGSSSEVRTRHRSRPALRPHQRRHPWSRRS